LANGAQVWQMVLRFVKRQTYFSSQIQHSVLENFCQSVGWLVKLNSKFFAKRCVPGTFCLAKKFGDIDPSSIKCIDFP